MSPPKNSYTNAAFCQQSEFYDVRCKSPKRRQSPVGAQTVHILDTSIRSIQSDPLPPRPRSGPKPVGVQYQQDNYEEEQEFYEEMIVDDRGAVQEKKFVVVHNQHYEVPKTRYEYIPMIQHEVQQQRMASPPKVLYHEEVDASTGRLHRYATIPSDDELEEIERREEKDENGKRYALVPVEEVRNKSRYAVVPTSRYERPQQVQQQVISPQPRRPPPNPVATQKLHELLTTPKKKLPNPIRRTPMSPISPIQPARTPSRAGTAPRAQQKLNYTLGTRQLQDNKRHTAIVAPICSSPVQSVYSETTFSNKTDSSMNMSLRKAPVQASIAIAAFMMILCGCVTTGLCIYMISYMGRNYYLDFGILSGFICFLLGLLGFRSRHIYWLPNRNYLSGYFVLSVFSLLTCVGLLVLLFMEPKPGSLIADMTSGAVCGISGLSLFLASIGIVASYCCNVPPPDNRVEHCAPGFTV